MNKLLFLIIPIVLLIFILLIIYVYIKFNVNKEEEITFQKFKNIINIFFNRYLFHLRNINSKGFKKIENYKGNQDLRNSKQKIPYKIFQTFKTDYVPVSLYKATRRWIEKNPEYDYTFYTDEKILDYIKKEDFKDFEFTKEDFLKAYDKIKPGAGKADLFRLLIIYNEGGCYFDIDNLCVTPLKSLIKKEDEVVTGIGFRNDFHQWGLIYVKNHIFIKKTLELAIKNILEEKFIDDRIDLENVTGPFCMDKAIKNFLEIPKDYKFKKGINKIKNVEFTVLEGDLFGYNIVCDYINYKKDLKELKLKHWKEHKIY